MTVKDLKAGKLYKHKASPDCNVILIVRIDPHFDEVIGVHTSKYQYCYIDEPDEIWETYGTELKMEITGWEEVKEL